MHGHAIAHRIVIGDRSMHFHLVLADFGAIVRAFAHQVGGGKSCFDVAELEQHVAFEIVRAVVVNRDGALYQRLLRGVVGGKLAHFQLDPAQGFLGGGVVDRRDRGERLAAIACALARQHMFSAGDRQNAEGLVAIGAGHNRFDAREFCRFGNVDLKNFRV